MLKVKLRHVQSADMLISAAQLDASFHEDTVVGHVLLEGNTGLNMVVPSHFTKYVDDLRGVLGSSPSPRLDDSLRK